MVKKLLLFLLVLVSAYALREGWFFFLARQRLPIGTMIGDVNVEYLLLEEAGEKVAEAYSQPIAIYSNVSGERVEVSPAELGFELDLRPMLEEAEAGKNAMEWWVGYIGYLLDRPIAPVEVALMATHDSAEIDSVIQLAADLMIDEPLPPRVEPETLRFLDGESGNIADLEASKTALTNALYTAGAREVELISTFAEAPPLDFSLLQDTVENQLNVSGLVTVGFIVDLETGEEISVNGDAVVSGLSIMKIPIMIEVFRAIEGQPNFDQQKLLNQMIIESSNLAANLLLDVVAGQDNAYLGSDILTASMQNLGLTDTYIVTPYEEPARPERPLLRTPGNTGESLLTKPEDSMQTTAEEIATLLKMIYECANGGGALLALYPDNLNATECQSMLDLLSLNIEGRQMIRNGMPSGTKLSHKHGYGFDIHGDAGIIYSEGGDYVLVTYVTDPGVDWLIADLSFPIMRETARIVYNYFNFENPYVELEAAATASATEAQAIFDEALEAGTYLTTTLTTTSTVPTTTTVPTEDQ